MVTVEAVEAASAVVIAVVAAVPVAVVASVVVTEVSCVCLKAQTGIANNYFRRPWWWRQRTRCSSRTRCSPWRSWRRRWPQGWKEDDCGMCLPFWFF